MLALAALEDWYITSLDVHSAYLYGKLDKEIYMEQPVLKQYLHAQGKCYIQLTCC